MIFLHKNETNTRFDIVCFLLCVATIEVDKLRMEIFVNVIKKICSENIFRFFFFFFFFFLIGLNIKRKDWMARIKFPLS